MQKILIADDDLTSRTVLVQAVRSEGYSTIEASTGMRAWNILSDNSDIVGLITDMMMPDLSGENLIQLMRGTAQYKDTPIIMVSGVVPLADINHILELGASRFLPKPVNLGYLREYLAALFEEEKAKK